MVPRRLTAILPDKTLAQAIDTTYVHSVAAIIDDQSACMTTWRCRALHDTIEDPDLFGDRQVALATTASYA